MRHSSLIKRRVKNWQPYKVKLIQPYAAQEDTRFSQAEYQKLADKTRSKTAFAEMWYVPLDLLWQILVQLPAKSLFRFRSVCKEWLCIIDDSHFIKDHTVFNQLYSTHTLLTRNKSGAPLYSFSLDSLNFIDGPQMIHATLIKNSIRLRLPDLFRVTICNGLILIPGVKFWAILNPLTKEHRKLPQPQPPNAAAIRWIQSYGFGYDYVADDYKVVRIDQLLSERDEFRALVYSLKRDSWRVMKDFPCGNPWQVRATFMDGTLYWSSERGTLVALDLTTETYYRLPLPPVDQTTSQLVCRLVGLDRCLFCCVIYYTSDLFDVWVMEDDGVEKSWNKKLSLRVSVLNVPLHLFVVAYLKKKDQLLLQHHHGFLWCDVKNNSIKKFSIHGFPHIASSQICPGSLFRLNVHPSDIGTTSKRKRKMKTKMNVKTKKTDTRLKLCVRDAAKPSCLENDVCSEDIMCCQCGLKEE